MIVVGHVVRCLLTIVMLYFVWRETGPITALSLALIFLAIEVQMYWLRTITKIIRADTTATKA